MATEPGKRPTPGQAANAVRDSAMDAGRVVRDSMKGRVASKGETPASTGNVANIITVARILLAPVFIWLLLWDGGQMGVLRYVAAGLFIVAIATDSLDGQLARRRNLVTDVGIILDPIADKVLIGGALVLAIFVLIETKVASPLFELSLFRNRSFAFGNLANLMASIGRGGLQFLLIIWLQGIWLPLRGYSYESTPLWAGIFLLPMTLGFLLAGPVAGVLSDRYGARPFATGGMVLSAVTFLALIAIPVNFNYWAFAALIFLNGLGSAIFTAPNTAAIMSSVPAHQRGAASGVRGTFFNAGNSLSIGIFFSLMIVGLSATMPGAMQSGLTAQGVPAATAAEVAGTPPVGSLFAAFLGYNPISELLAPSGVLEQPGVNAAELTGQSFFPNLITEPFHAGLVVVFVAAALMMAIAALASLGAGGKYAHAED